MIRRSVEESTSAYHEEAVIVLSPAITETGFLLRLADDLLQSNINFAANNH